MIFVPIESPTRWISSVGFFPFVHTVTEGRDPNADRVIDIHGLLGIEDRSTSENGPRLGRSRMTFGVVTSSVESSSNGARQDEGGSNVRSWSASPSVSSPLRYRRPTSVIA